MRTLTDKRPELGGNRPAGCRQTTQHMARRALLRVGRRGLNATHEFQRVSYSQTAARVKRLENLNLVDCDYDRFRDIVALSSTRPFMAAILVLPVSAVRQLQIRATITVGIDFNQNSSFFAGTATNPPQTPMLLTGTSSVYRVRVLEAEWRRVPWPANHQPRGGILGNRGCSDWVWVCVTVRFQERPAGLEQRTAEERRQAIYYWCRYKSAPRHSRRLFCDTCRQRIPFPQSSFPGEESRREKNS